MAGFQQQLNWQRLQLDWQCFLDELFRHLERSDPALPKNAVIALPIDDLDFQAHRLRELLLALRTLRHERLVYVLTGDVENIDISLKAEFYLSYLRREPTIPEKLRDEIAEQMEKLSLSLREKVIPGPHTFFLKGLPLVEATDWRPTPESPTLGKILDTLWTGKNQEQQETNNEKTLSRFLSQRSEVVRGSSLGDHMLLFRPLQAFFDRWGGKGHERDLNGIVGFLNIAIGRQEEPVTVVRSDSDVERIELSTGLGVYAPAPRLLGVVRTQTSTLHWMREVDFARKPLALEWNVEAQMFRVGRVVDQAPVEHLLALDLAAWKPKVFQIINGPSLTERPLGIVWTQLMDRRACLLALADASSPGSPSEWIKRVSEWNKHLELYTKNDGPDEERLVKAWCSSR